MGKARRLTGAAVVAAVLGMPSAWSPARAAMGPYTIAGGSTTETHVTEKAFVATCDPAFTGLPVNGVDGYVVDISSLVSHHGLRIDYTLLAGPTVPAAVGSIQAQLYTSGCAPTGGVVGSPGSIPDASSGALFVAVPGNAKWLVVDSTVTANVVFTVS